MGNLLILSFVNDYVQFIGHGLKDWRHQHVPVVDLEYIADRNVQAVTAWISHA
jgi:hypothetical protein